MIEGKTAALRERRGEGRGARWQRGGQGALEQVREREAERAPIPFCTQKREQELTPYSISQHLEQKSLPKIETGKREEESESSRKQKTEGDKATGRQDTVRWQRQTGMTAMRDGDFPWRELEIRIPRP